MTIIEIDYNFMEQRKSQYCWKNLGANKKLEKKIVWIIKKK